MPSVNFVGRVRYPSSWKHFERVASEYIFFFVHSGMMYIQEEEKQYTLGPNELLILEPGKMHVGYKTHAVEYSYFHFHVDWTPTTIESEEEWQEQLVDTPTLLFHGSQTTEETTIYIPKQMAISDRNVVYRMGEILHSAASEYYTSQLNHPAICSIRLYELFMTIYRHLYDNMTASNSDNVSKALITVQELKRFLDANILRKVSNDMILDRFDRNYDYLNRIYKKYYDVSIRQYINQSKINQAKDIIRDNDIKISTLGMMIGIDNPYYFSKLFKQYAGITPTEYYKQVRL
jgi:YesN/AraC family two-component response regulator